jgi:hypothetical protein
MNYFKVILSLLAINSLVSSASYPNGGGDPMPVIRLTDENCRTIYEIAQSGDDPEALARLLDGASPTYDFKLYGPLQLMIAVSRNRLFEFLFPLFRFPGEGHRKATANNLLKMALFYGNLEVAEFLLGQLPEDDFRDVWRHVYNGRTHEPWDLDGLKALISRNPKYASHITPKATDIDYARSANDALFLIELALHCDMESAKLGRPETFDASRFLAGIIQGFLGDTDMAKVIRHLCELGADVTPRLHEILDGRHGIYEQSRQILRECEMIRECEDIGKVTEEEAALYK